MLGIHVQDEVNRELMILQLQVTKLTGQSLHQALIELRDVDLRRRGGEMSFGQINHISKNLKYIELANTSKDMKVFNTLAKNYKVRYAVKEDPEEKDKALIFFEGQSQEVIEKCLKDYIHIFERENLAFENDVLKFEDFLSTQNIKLPEEIKEALSSEKNYQKLTSEQKQHFWDYIDKNEVKEIGILNGKLNGNKNRPLKNNLDIAIEKVKVRHINKDLVKRDRGER